MNKTFKVFVVDDHKIFREGLIYLISRMKGFEVIGEASNGKTFLEKIDELEMDIVIMDICMPDIDGVTATSKALEKHPDLRIIALTMFSDEKYYYRMIQAGVAGYILKESGKDELAEALHKVASGESYFSQKILHNIIINMNNVRMFKKADNHQEAKLTKRETEILNLICQGLSNVEISDMLYLSLRTIEGHKSNIFSKTGVKNSIGLVTYALKNHLVEI